MSALEIFSMTKVFGPAVRKILLAFTRAADIPKNFGYPITLVVFFKRDTMEKNYFVIWAEFLHINFLGILYPVLNFVGKISKGNRRKTVSEYLKKIVNVFLLHLMPMLLKYFSIFVRLR